MDETTDRAMQAAIDEHEAAYHPGKPCPEGAQGECSVRYPDPDVWVTTGLLGWGEPSRD